MRVCVDVIKFQDKNNLSENNSASGESSEDSWRQKSRKTNTSTGLNGLESAVFKVSHLVFLLFTFYLFFLQVFLLKRKKFVRKFINYKLKAGSSTVVCQTL